MICFSLVFWEEENKSSRSHKKEEVVINQSTSQEGKDIAFSCVIFGCGWYEYVDHGYILGVFGLGSMKP